MRGLGKNYMKREHIYIYIHGHRDSMKESANGRFFEKYFKALLNVINQVLELSVKPSRYSDYISWHHKTKKSNLIYYSA